MPSSLLACLLLLLPLISARCVTSNDCWIGQNYGLITADQWTTLKPDQSGCYRVQVASTIYSASPASLIIGLYPEADPDAKTETVMQVYALNDTSASLLPSTITYMKLNNNQVTQTDPSFNCKSYPNGTDSLSDLYVVINTDITTQVYIGFLSGQVTVDECQVDSNDHGWSLVAILALIAVVLIVISVVITIIALIVRYCVKRSTYSYRSI